MNSPNADARYAEAALRDLEANDLEAFINDEETCAGAAAPHARSLLEHPKGRSEWPAEGLPAAGWLRHLTARAALRIGTMAIGPSVGRKFAEGHPGRPVTRLLGGGSPRRMRAMMAAAAVSSCLCLSGAALLLLTS